MIKIIDGDLFTSDARIIAHQVNCQGKMGSGVALQVRNKYPHVYEEYKNIASPKMLGEIQLVPCNTAYIGYDCGNILVPCEEQWICNLFAQDNYGYDGKQYTSMDALVKCFKKLNGCVHEKNNNFNSKIAMPYKIGCVRGGADWEEVYCLIENIFYDCNIELWRYDK